MKAPVPTAYVRIGSFGDHLTMQPARQVHPQERTRSLGYRHGSNCQLRTHVDKAVEPPAIGPHRPPPRSFSPNRGVHRLAEASPRVVDRQGANACVGACFPGASRSDIGGPPSRRKVLRLLPVFRMRPLMPDQKLLLSP
jgi:hypothetical protein